MQSLPNSHQTVSQWSIEQLLGMKMSYFGICLLTRKVTETLCRKEAFAAKEASKKIIHMMFAEYHLTRLWQP